MTHALKTLPEYFEAVWQGEKTFEVRKFDRPFKVGETLLLQEWDEASNYTGREVQKQITYILPGSCKFGLYTDFCIMGIKDIDTF